MLRCVQNPLAPSSQEVWQSLREHCTQIPKYQEHWHQAALASQEPIAQVKLHELSSHDIKLDLSMGRSYKTDIVLERRGERNIPK